MKDEKHLKSVITATYGAANMSEALNQELASEFEVTPHDNDDGVVLKAFDPFSLEAATIAVDVIVGLGVSLTYDLMKNKVLSVISRFRHRQEVRGPL